MTIMSRLAGDKLLWVEDCSKIKGDHDELLMYLDRRAWHRSSALLRADGYGRG